MKTKIPYALLGAILSVSAPAATTTPVGYVTETIQGGQFNLIGLTVHEPTAASGSVESVSGVQVTSSGTFANLEDGEQYILEVTSGGAEGAIQEVQSFTDDTVNTVDDLTVIGDGLTSGDSFTIRAAATVGSIFGDSNSAGLQSSANADPNEADVVYVPNGQGGFDRFFYSTAQGATGWLNANTFADGTDFPIVYTDGVLIQRRASSDLDVVFTGEVKTSNTTIMVTNPFTYIGGVYPTGSTLDSTNLADSVQSSANADPNEADVVYLPNNSGSYDRYFHSTLDGAEGWLNAATFAAAGDQSVTSGLIIQLRDAPFNANFDAPSFYSNL